MSCLSATRAMTPSPFSPLTPTAMWGPFARSGGANTEINQAHQLATAGGEIFVASFFSDSVQVFSTADNGNVAPLRNLVGANTGINEPRWRGRQRQRTLCLLPHRFGPVFPINATVMWLPSG